MFQLRPRLILGAINIDASSLRGKDSAAFHPLLQPPLPTNRARTRAQGRPQAGWGWPCDAVTVPWWDGSCRQPLAYCPEQLIHACRFLH